MNSDFKVFTPLLFLFTIFINGCNQDLPEQAPVSYSVPVHDSCSIEPDHHFVVSEPENLSDQKTIPLIIVLDPHGDGKLAVDKFSEALIDIQAVIAGSDKIKNNYANFESSFSHLIDDVLAKYPADPDKIIIAGFSGGARMAYYYGMSHKVLGIIMFGAGPGSWEGVPAGKRVYAVSGTRDFNFIEQYIPPFSPFIGEKEYRSDFFRGTHQWPPSKNIYEAVAYMLKDDKDFPAGVSARITENLLLEYDSLLNSNDLFFAAKSLEKAGIFAAGEKNKNRISAEINEFKTNPAWTDYRKKFEAYLDKELRLKQAYASKLQEPDTSWWNKEIRSLNQNIQSCSDPVQEDFYYRIKGFIGIILYSQINAVLQNQVLTPELASLMIIYEEAEPESPDLENFNKRIRQLSKRED